MRGERGQKVEKKMCAVFAFYIENGVIYICPVNFDTVINFK